MSTIRNIIIGAGLLLAGYATGSIDQQPGPPATPARPAAAAAWPRVERGDRDRASGPGDRNGEGGFAFGQLLLTLLGAGFAAGIYRNRKFRKSIISRLPDGADAPRPDVPRTASFTGASTARPAPRALLRNPYGPECAGLSFEEQMQIAARASLLSSRVIGVIHFAIPGPPVAGDELVGEDQAEILAQRFRRALRTSDCVRILNSREIVIFVSLLSRREILIGISGRLQAVARDSGLFGEDVELPEPGLAMYPIDGYSSDELILAASRRTRLPAGREPVLLDAVWATGGART